MYMLLANQTPMFIDILIQVAGPVATWVIEE
jgi:hypothetical protein